MSARRSASGLARRLAASVVIVLGLFCVWFAVEGLLGGEVRRLGGPTAFQTFRYAARPVAYVLHLLGWLAAGGGLLAWGIHGWRSARGR